MNDPAPSDEAIRASRAAAQWLTAPRQPAQPPEVVRHLVAIQAQLPSAAALVVRVRSSGTSAVDVAAAYGSGELVRTWLFRGTLHVVAAEDVDWLLGLVRQTIMARSARRRTELGLDDSTLERSASALNAGLSDGEPRTRSELFDLLSAAGIDHAGQRGIHLIRTVALTGTVCFGPDRGHEPTWVARQPRADRRSRPKALAELARRYRAAYGPTDARDLAAWAGLTAVEARQAWSGAAAADGRTAGREPAVRLLPHFDPYLLGYRSRELVVDPVHAAAVWTGGGYLMPTVVAAGLAVATWEAVRRPGSITVTVRPFSSLGDDVRTGIDEEVADIGRFLNARATWTIAAASVRA